MITHALVVDGLVVETAGPLEVDGAAIPATDRYPADILVALTTAQAKKVVPGWTHDGKVFAAPVEPPVPVPQSISRAQAFDVMAGFLLPDGRALDTALEQDTQATLDGTADLPDGDPLRQEAKRAASWVRNAAVFERGHPRILAAAAQYDLSDAQIDALFQAGAAIA